MMQRTPEPEVMDGLEQSEAYAQADFSEVNQSFVDRFCDQYPDFEAGTLIDLGCGPADILVRFCHQRPSVKVVGVDGSEVMIHLAKEAVEKEGLEAQIDLVCGILPGAISPDARFDAISSNSLLHHLHDPGVLWSEVSRIAKPGAPVFVMDLIRPESSEDAQEARRHLRGERSASAPTGLLQFFLGGLHARRGSSSAQGCWIGTVEGGSDQ